MSHSFLYLIDISMFTSFDTQNFFKSVVFVILKIHKFTINFSSFVIIKEGLTVGSQSAQCQEYPRFFGVFFKGGIRQWK